MSAYTRPRTICAVRTKNKIVSPVLPKCEMLTRPVTPRPMFNPSFFSLRKEDGPIPRDDRLRDGHPNMLCRNLVPMIDTPCLLHRKREDQLTTYAQRCILTPIAVNTKGLSKVWRHSQSTFKEWD